MNKFKGLFKKYTIVAATLLAVNSPLLAYSQVNSDATSPDFIQGDKGFMPGAKILEPACDPQISPAQDAYKSCEGANINRDNFYVTVSFDPKQPLTDTKGNPWGDQLQTLVPDKLDFPEDTVFPIYDSNGNEITGKDGKPKSGIEIVHVASGEPVLYKKDGVNKGFVYTKNGYITSEGKIVNTSSTLPKCSSLPEGSDKECLIDNNGNVSYLYGAKIYSISKGYVLAPSNQILYNLIFNSNPDSLKAQISTLEGKVFKLRYGQMVTPFEETRVSFELRYEGSFACVYAREQSSDKVWRVGDHYPVSADEVNNVLNLGSNATNDYSSYETEESVSHCVKAPPPVVTFKQLSFGELISPICLEYDTSNSLYEDKVKSGRSFVGVAILCIEDTMMRIFVPNSEDFQNANGEIIKPASFFSNVQNKLKSTITALFALYVIFFGYKLMLGKNVPDKRTWMWFGLKFALVVYFALGSGMSDLLPWLINSSKQLATMAMEAGFAQTPPPALAKTASTLNNAKNSVIEAQKEYDEALSKLQEAQITDAKVIASADTLQDDIKDLQDYIDTIINGNPGLESLKQTMEEKEAIYNNANSDFQLFQSQLQSYIDAYNSKLKQQDDANALVNLLGKPLQSNGSFENINVTDNLANNKSDIYSSLDGWDSSNGIEVKSGAGADGAYYIELDSTQNSSMWQNLTTNPNVKYDVSFIYKRNDNTSVDTSSSKIDIFWDNKKIDTAQQDGAGWASYSYNLQGSSSGISNLKFAASGASDSVGGYLDKITIKLNKDSVLAFQQKAASELAKANKDLCVMGGVCPSGITSPINVATGEVNKSSQYYISQLAASSAKTDYDRASTEYNNQLDLYNKTVASLNDLNSISSLNTSITAKAVIDAQRIVDEKSEILNSTKEELLQLQKIYNKEFAKLDEISSDAATAYPYCDFRYQIYDNDYRSMKLWDMIDCKLSHYLGLNIDKNELLPMNVLIFSLSVFTSLYGIAIAFFGFVFLIFVFLITLRTVHIYVIAVVGLVLLVYTSPIFITASLFEFTKGMFSRWLNQLIAFVLQPFILFAFLVMMFFAIDTVMYGGNHMFTENNLIASKSSTGPAETLRQCKDKYAPGCILQVMAINGGKKLSKSGDAANSEVSISDEKPWPSSLFSIFSYRSVHWNNYDVWILIGLSKLILILFVTYSILGLVQQTASIIAGDVANKEGIGKLSFMPVSSVADIGSNLYGLDKSATSKGYQAAKTVYKTGREGARAVQAVKDKEFKAYATDAAARGLKELSNKKGSGSSKSSVGSKSSSVRKGDRDAERVAHSDE